MARIVMKFGGTSVADIEHIKNVALHIKREIEAGNEVVVVLSAMSGTTNELVALTKQAIAAFAQPHINEADLLQEYDVIVSSGEQVTIGLLSIILQHMGFKAHSMLGWQVPIFTDAIHKNARIQKVNGQAIINKLSNKEIVVIAGFQGLAPDNTITTLGRGGSDTSAVAIAASINADRCDIYTDVDGVYTTDPRIEKKARAMAKISFEEMLEMSSLGAKVMQVRSVELAMIHNIRTFVRSSFNNNAQNGTLICNEDEIVEKQIVTGIALVKDEAKISLWDIVDKPNAPALIFETMANNSINVDMIIQNVSKDGLTINITFTVHSDDLEQAVKSLKAKQNEIGFKTIESSDDLTKISIIGIGMRSHYGVAAASFAALAKNAIHIRAITTSEIKISILIDSAYTELAVRTLHKVYNLGTNND